MDGLCERGQGISFAHCVRYTDYLVGDLERLNNSKLAEGLDRVKHSIEEDT